jgi:DNA mismatch repair protein MLH1
LPPLPPQHGQASADLHTPKGGSTLANVRIAFGQVLARELLEFTCEAGAAEGGEEGAEGEGERGGGGLQFKARGYISNANYNMKKSVFMLFINHRMVRGIGRGHALKACGG